MYKPDIYRTAAAQLDIITPETNYKTEGSHAEAWTLAAQGREIRMGADLFMDGKQFNPEKSPTTWKKWRFTICEVICRH